VGRGKENSKGGCSFKLSSDDKQSIICQITSGRLDNAVEATYFIIKILSNSITPQTVGVHSKKMAFMLLLRQNVLFSRPTN
jgi:hypothetical protein